MKAFDLEAAMRGEPIQTRDKKPAKFIAHVPEAVGGTVAALVDRRILGFYENGRLHNKEWDTHTYDLFMAPKKRTIWMNIYADTSAAFWYSSKSVADEGSRLGRIGGRAWPLEIEE